MCILSINAHIRALYFVQKTGTRSKKLEQIFSGFYGILATFFHVILCIHMSRNHPFLLDYLVSHKIIQINWILYAASRISNFIGFLVFHVNYPFLLD